MKNSRLYLGWIALFCVVLPQGGLTPANFVSQFKTTALAALLAGYGINVNANSVIVYGAPQ